MLFRSGLRDKRAGSPLWPPPITNSPCIGAIGAISEQSFPIHRAKVNQGSSPQATFRLSCKSLWIARFEFFDLTGVRVYRTLGPGARLCRFEVKLFYLTMWIEAGPQPPTSNAQMSATRVSDRQHGPPSPVPCARPSQAASTRPARHSRGSPRASGVAAAMAEEKPARCTHQPMPPGDMTIPLDLAGSRG